MNQNKTYRCLESGDWSQVLGCHSLPKKKECCKEITFYNKPKYTGYRFLSTYGAFLGIWTQVRIYGDSSQNEVFL